MILLKVKTVRKCMNCHNWFFNHRFKLQNHVCNGCHYLTILSVTISDNTIVTIKMVDCRCNINKSSKSEAITSLKNSVSEDCGYI